MIARYIYATTDFLDVLTQFLIKKRNFLYQLSSQDLCLHSSTDTLFLVITGHIEQEILIDLQHG